MSLWICRIPDKALEEYNYYMDTHKLRIVVSNMKNANTRAELEKIKSTVLQNLSQLPAAPSVPFEKRPPPLATVCYLPPPIFSTFPVYLRTYTNCSALLHLARLCLRPLPTVFATNASACENPIHNLTNFN